MVAYYADLTSSTCGSQRRLRLDTRDWEHVAMAVTGPAGGPRAAGLSAVLAAGSYWSMHIKPAPEGGDWRLDPWEARYGQLLLLMIHFASCLCLSSVPSYRRQFTASYPIFMSGEGEVAALARMQLGDEQGSSVRPLVAVLTPSCAMPVPGTFLAASLSLVVSLAFAGCRRREPN